MLPEVFESEDKLRELWAVPSTRKALLKSLENAGFGFNDLVEIQKIIDAEKSDIFDVLEFVAFAKKPLTRVKRIEESDLDDKERRVKRLKKRYTIGNVNFDSVIIADFDESLKSVITSLLYTDVSPKDKYFITFNQWFDESLLNETALQPIYYPSVNKKNLEEFKKKFLDEFDENPNHISLLSYDLVGLIYYLSLKNDITNINKVFNSKNSFKGKIGIFDIKNNKINHRLNFYKIEDQKLIEIF